MDKFSNRNIKMTRNTVTFGPKIQRRKYSNSIRPIEAKDINPTVETFATLDIETVKTNIQDNEQLPIAITTTYSLDGCNKKTKLFLVEPKLFMKHPNSAVNRL
jgi:hypothetical protein